MGRCYNSIVVRAPVEKVWAKLRDFHDFSWARGVVDSCEPVGDLRGDQVGARRRLNGVFTETLLELSDVERRVVYSIDDAPGTPVAKENVRDYVGTVRALPVTKDGSTFVEWSSRYDSSRDASVGEFCNPIYQGLLEALRDACAK